MRRPIRAALCGATTIVFVSGLGGSLAAPAQASSQPIHIVGTNNIGVSIRPTPSTEQPIIGRIPEGESPDYRCYVRGQNIGGTDVWFYVTYNGMTGYYTSFYDDVPFEYQTDLEGYYGISQCGAQPAQPQPAPAAAEPFPTDERINGTPGDGVEPKATIDFNRTSTRDWALTHALDNQPPWGACTWFVSQALWAGGIQQEPFVWAANPRYPAKSYGVIDGVLYDAWQPYASAAKQAKVLWEHLKEKPYTEVTPLDGDRFRRNTVPEAQIGDVIAYDWGKGEGISHLAIITAIAPGPYPWVSEWGTTVDDEAVARYSTRGWTYSQNSKKWLQNKKLYPKVTAFLLHFNTP